MKDTNPNPSHPNNSMIKFGIKIKRFMDAINISTKIVKRLINLSSFIYVSENLRTFAEIISTTHENNIPVVSAIIVIVIGVDLIDSRVHSISITLLSRVIYNEIGTITARVLQSRFLANL